LDPENNLILHIYFTCFAYLYNRSSYIHNECNESSKTVQELGDGCGITIDAGTKYQHDQCDYTPDILDAISGEIQIKIGSWRELLISVTVPS